MLKGYLEGHPRACKWLGSGPHLEATKRSFGRGTTGSVWGLIHQGHKQLTNFKVVDLSPMRVRKLSATDETY